LNKVQLITIDDNHEGQRIDNFLLNLLKGVPKSHIYRILRKGEVRVNKKRVKAPYKLASGDEVRVPPVRISEQSEAPVNVKLDKVQELERQIIYESDAVLVVNKPSGWAVHGGSGLSFGVIEALRQLRPEARFLELVHRLDRDTSGCLLVAKKRSALRYLHQQLREKTLYKEYVALAAGRWPKRARRIDAPLLKNTLKSGERVVRVDPEGKPSVTEFILEQSFENCSLMQCSPVTGRTHQIRVHAQYVGCPLAGDPKYGDASFNQYLKETYGFTRLFLHARKLEFHEKAEGKRVSVTAEYDAAMSDLLTKLGRGF
jgi:23S rRNA pseudouridine955/2504/2580 synthase